MEQKKLNMKCKKHPEYKIEYIRINNLFKLKESPLFYCLNCVDEDKTFNIHDYLLIKPLILSGIDEILPEYPAYCSYEIISKLIKITNEQRTIDEVIDLINDFFKNFRQTVNAQIDIQQKQMIKTAEDFTYNYKEVLKKYSDITQMEELRDILLNNNSDNNNYESKEELCTKLISEQLNQSYNKSQQLFNLLQENISKFLFNSSSALKIQEDILNSIKKLDLFDKLPEQQKLNVQLQKTDYNQGQTCQEIILNQNNQQILFIKQELNYNKFNTVSSIILDQNKKYVFRFQINRFTNNETLFIGLMQNHKINTEQGSNDNLYLNLTINQQYIYIPGQQRLYFTNQKEIEIRICINEKLLEITDYPFYDSKLGLSSQSQFDKVKDLRFFIGMNKLNNYITFTDSFIVNKFD